MKQKEKKRPRWRRALRLLLGLALIGALCYGGLIGYVCYKEANVPTPTDYDSIIVLGAQVLPSGEPSVQLRWRLDKALEMYRLRPCPTVVCGAQGGKEPEPEGDVMYRLMLADGVPESDLHAETKSEDTRQNLANAMEILSALGCERPLIVTSDYHLPRALALAKDAGLNAQGAGSLCRPEFSFWLKNHGREALAWVKYWLMKYVGLKL